MKIFLFVSTIIGVVALNVIDNAYVTKMQCKTYSASTGLTIEQINELCR